MQDEDDKTGSTHLVESLKQQIHEHKIAEGALKASEAKMRSILENIGIGVALISPGMEILELNRRMREWFPGVDPGRRPICYRAFNNPPREDICDYCPTVKTLQDGKVHEAITHTPQAGGVRNYRVVSSPIFDESGAVAAAIEMVEDITERKQMEDALRQNRERHRSILRTAMDGFWLTDKSGRLLEVNEAYCRMSGYSEQELLAMRILDLDVLETEEDIARNIQTLAENVERRFESRHRRKDGSLFDVEVSVQYRHSDDGQVVVSIRDITRQKQLERERSESEKRFRELFNHMGAGVAIYDSPDDGNSFVFIDLNEAGLANTQKTISEVVGREVREVFPGVEALGLFDVFRRVWRTGKPMQHPTTFYKDRKLERWFENYVYRIPSGELVAIFEDVTERKRAEEERGRLMSAIEQAGEAVIITDADGTIQYVNPTFKKITGYARNEAVGENPRILKSGVQDEAFYQELWGTVTSGKIWNGRIVNKRKDGVLFTEEASISPVMDESGAIINYVAVKRDITRELETEKRLIQAQRIEAIGVLAGGIAHDFNNLLFPIVGMAEMLLEDLTPDSAGYESVAEIFTAAQRAGALVKQILSFSRQSDIQKAPVRIQRVLKEVIKLSRSTIPSNIEIHSEIQSDCGLVMADPTQIHQIAMNLITNAYHAVEETGGEISVGLKETRLMGDESVCESLEPGKYVVLTITDNGCGIDPSVLVRIFEPYFTTKPRGKGTGLGLSVVYGIVKGHSGDILVDSEVGRGTTFTVYMPLMEKTSDATASGIVEALPTGNERIMLVDDEEAVARLESRILERLGYRTSYWTSSPDALAAFRANPEAFDAVISDMTMPKMTGDRLAAELLSIKPNIPIIICTGFSERISEETAASIGVEGFLMKPVVKSDLAKMVRKVLDEE